MKKIALSVFFLLATVITLLTFLSYSSNSFPVVQTNVPNGGVVEADYLSRSKSDSSIVLTYPLRNTFGLDPYFVKIGEGSAQGEEGVFLRRDSKDSLLSYADDTLALVEGSDFHNGIIEVELKGLVSSGTSIINKFISRGFVGVCFRIDEQVTSFECIYLRPENGFTDDPKRQQHAVQYISVPDWGFPRLREEAPEQYENPAPIKPDTWHKLRIEVTNSNARLFIDGSPKPILEIDDLKLGPQRSGKIGLWVGIGSEAYFRNLKITKRYKKEI